MGFVKWLIAGTIGGIVGAAIWATIVHYAHAEVGWIAWGIGLLVGICVRFAAGDEDGFGPGITAVSLAGFSIVGGKYIAAWTLVAAALSTSGQQVTAENMVIRFANETVREREAQGQKVVWPANVTAESAEKQADFPVDIWQAAAKKWSDFPPAEQQQQIAAVQQEVKAFQQLMAGMMRKEVFGSMFGPYDILWFVLAAMTAFKVGSGASSEE